jgi:hypothetical protein
MRYHWGLGVGHVYSHGQNAAGNSSTSTTAMQTVNIGADTSSVHEGIPEWRQQGQDDGSDTENPELGFDNGGDDDDWIDLREEDYEGELSGVDDEDEDEELMVAMDDMYGFIEQDGRYD